MNNSPKKILFIDHGMEFGIDHYKHYPMGGSEASLLMLAKGVAEQGNSAVILNNIKQKQESNNLVIDNLNLLPQYLEIADLAVINRFINPELINTIKQFNIPIYYYSHDAYDQNIISSWLNSKYRNNNYLNHINKFFTVSNWQKNTFFKYFNINSQKNKNKFVTLGNSLDSSLYFGYQKRDLNKLVFASIPYKGLEFLNNIINDVVQETKNPDLRLHVFSDMALYGREDNNSRERQNYDKIYSELDRNPNIVLRDLLSMKDLAFEFASSNLYIHPNIYHETFSMVMVQAQAAGCLPVTTDYGAVKEVIENQDNIINEPNIHAHSTYTKYIKRVSYLLNPDNTKKINKQRINSQEFVKQFDYLKISKKFLDNI